MESLFHINSPWYIRFSLHLVQVFTLRFKICMSTTSYFHLYARVQANYKNNLDFNIQKLVLSFNMRCGNNGLNRVWLDIWFLVLQHMNRIASAHDFGIIPLNITFKFFSDNWIISNNQLIL